MTNLDRAREIREAQTKAVAGVPLGLPELDAIHVAAGLLLRCEGHVITTGMGKAGNAARKIAGTLSSTGTPAFFVHPGEAQHGDLGAVRSYDVLLAVSISGQTREVLEMIRLSRPLGAPRVIVLTSEPTSPVAQAADVVLWIGRPVEPCVLGLTPSASILAALALGDILALLTMEARGFTAVEYGLRHHGGYLGQKAREASPDPPRPLSHSQG